jgi:hypothetical protein
MDSLSTLRAETKALRLDIEKLEERLGAETITFENAQRLWSSTHRLKAVHLAERMLSYVPNGDPRIAVLLESGNHRIITSDAVNCIEAPFSEESAVAQLCIVRSQLCKLANNLDADA